MDQVPKILKPLVSQWTREGFIVSFKVGRHHTYGRVHSDVTAFLLP